MANPSERGGYNPSPATHPRMTAPPPSSSPNPSEPGESLKGQISGMAGQVRETLQSTASDLSSRAAHASEDLRRGMRQGGQWAEETAENLWEGMAAIIRRNPVVAVAGAFGAGCLLTCCIAAWTSSSRREMWR
jgi:hypothetical protein